MLSFLYSSGEKEKIISCTRKKISKPYCGTTYFAAVKTFLLNRTTITHIEGKAKRVIDQRETT